MKQLNKIKGLLLLMTAMVAFLQVDAQLNGTYTVYGTGANYANLQAAVNALSAGVSGPVTFKIRPGNWSSATTSRAVIGSVAGASATNTITFEAENGNAATTIITNTASSSASTSNCIFYFDDAKYIRVRNLTLNKTHSTYGTCVRFAGDADYNIVEDCVLTGSTSSSTSSNKARVYGTSLKNANNNLIKDNTIERGSYAIYWRGSSSSSSNLSPDNEFSGNTIDNPRYAGIYAYYTKNQKINNNTINTTLSSYFYGAVYCYYGDGALEVKNNSGSITGKTSTTYALRIAYCDGNSTDHAVVSGNEFTMQSSSTIYPLYNYYCNWLTFEDNEITSTCTGTSSTTIYTSYRGGNNTIKDNEVSSTNRRTHNFYGAYFSDNATITGNEFTVKSNDNAGYYGYTYAMYYSDNSKFNNNEVNLTYSGYYYWYNRWTYYSDDCELIGNEITEQKNNNNGYYMYNYFGYYSDDLMFKNNKVTAQGGPNYYWYTYFNYYGYDVTMEGNDIDITHTRGGSSIYSVYNYFYGYGVSTVRDNKINATCQNNGGYAYGIYLNFISGGTGDVENNEIVARGGYGAYGMYLYYPKGSVKNNAVFTKANSRNYTFACYYPDNAKIYNNTFHSAATASTNYGAYVYMYGSQYSAEFKNNSISKSSSNGYAIYHYATNPDNFTSDYNNIYQPSGSLYYNPYFGSNYSTIQALRTGTGNDMNSLSYMPGFMNVSSGDLRPDASNPNSWALNGRGVQMAGN
ncbi:MAG TPA: right-handed parallel beta-helix repeat-containing protein, partial [Flavipsychrobacter sp.]